MQKSLAVMVAALLASCWLGCPGTGSGSTGGACGTSTDKCAANSDCCSGFVCLNGVCAFQGGGNNGNNGNGNGNGGVSSGSAGNGSSTGHASSTGQASNGSSSAGSTGAIGGLIGGGSSGGGLIGGGSSGGGTLGGGSSSGGTTGTTYCDGLQLSSSSENTVLLETYVFSSQLETDGCSTTLSADDDGTGLQSVGGIYDLDTHDNGATTPAGALFPGGCDDLGLSVFTAPSGTPFTTPPTGASTIAAGRGQSAISVYGVVTAINPWASTPTAYSGTVYLQDIPTGSPPPNSGVEVFFSKTNAATYGTAPVRGDVIEVTNVTWSPYKGQNEFAAGATTVVTILGTSPLPTPVSLDSTDLGPTPTANGQQYLGMRVVVDDGPFTVTGSEGSGDCPADLQDTVD